ncbi:hypothetical protein TNCV_4283151 [Trichonephila clavipes]|nr:hypothetical protein TNCV_4283151 [Trichonephila clavipes]
MSSTPGVTEDPASPGLMHLKFLEAQSSPVGLLGKFGELGGSSESSNPRIYVTVWCQKWDFMPITRAMDEQLKVLLEDINALKNGQEETRQ